MVGSHYTYPTQTEVDYFRSKGMNTMRLCFRWERLQRSINTAFNSTEFNRLHTFVAQTTAKGMHVILNPHNFARYYPDISTFTTMQSGSVGVVGSATVPDSAFADFWSRLAAVYKTNGLVIFGLMNEPNALPASQWVSAANSAIAAIRATGATNLILVPGISWTGAHSWVSSGNSVAMLNIVDPINNHAFEVHQYLDANSSGSSTNIVDANIGRTRLVAFTQWLKTNQQRGFLGEFAVANSMIGSGSWQIGDEALTNMLDSIQANADVWLGWTWWAAGPWWGDYIFTLEPASVGVDRPVMPILKSFIPIPPPTLVVRPPNQIQFSARPGFLYQPQSISALGGGAWSNHGSPITGSGQTTTVTMPTGAAERGFYRVRVSRGP
jgi:endoglucanase